MSRELDLEQELAASQRLEGLARLAGGVAHAFNNLLTIILSCADALERDLREKGTAQVGDAADVREAAERARDLTGKLLAIARRQVIAPVPLDLGRQLAESEKVLRALLPEDIDLSVEAGPGLWPVRCDPGQLDQVLLILVTNARDAMPAGGRLEVAAANVEAAGPEAMASPEASGCPCVRLTVRDDGVGMPLEVRARLFEPFFTTKPVGKGTGLGLATVYGIAQQNRWSIRVESEPGRGTCLELLLPRCAGQPRPAAPQARSGARGGDELVLLVEDEPAVRDVTVRALTSAGYRVLAAGEGKEALALLASAPEPPDLLLTDVVMPGMDGRQLAEEVRRRRPGIEVLFVSGHAHELLANGGVLDEHVNLLCKPYTPAVLLERVRTSLDGREPVHGH